MEKFIDDKKGNSQSHQKLRIQKPHTPNEFDEKYITVQVTESTLDWIVNKKKVKGITDLTIRLIEDKMVINGTAKKLKIPIHFQIVLRPLEANNRHLSFQVTDLKPVNQHWITTKLLNKPPLIRYHKGIINLNLNHIEQAKSIRFGNLKLFEVRDEKLWIGVQF
ncbi:hypothetical protein [Alkalihalobacterium chitinilyticum]|uniref:DUF2140 family protein n=1 Tax=Alkalihalobacterium chitinilyticum TaxID=2980103 RepID=A0ABT5VD23_9BACI|nr:hypothetical protein [Alkalihalobacterium chitinilyticum]MDE5413190.1 hypothetical protein [Alkalihalobacterium chitinilyticum]